MITRNNLHRGAALGRGKNNSKHRPRLSVWHVALLCAAAIALASYYAVRLQHPVEAASAVASSSSPSIVARIYQYLLHASGEGSKLLIDSEVAPRKPEVIVQPEAAVAVMATTTTTRAVFYNIFVPSTPDGKQNAIRIIREQLDQVAQSYAATSLDHPMPVYYYTIGAADAMTPETMKSLCPSSIKCQHMVHHEEGSEAITLDALRQYCIKEPDATVTYIHSKGSFHPLELNERWRRILTDAALSELCYSHMGAECNLCGVQFHALWTHFLAGNMWTVSCNYAAQLAPISTFESTIVEVVKRFLVLRLRGRMTDNMFQPERKDRFGLERYGTEHWIGSHPDVRPCDCTHMRDLLVADPKNWTLGDLDFHTAPRDYTPPVDRQEPAFSQIMNDPASRVREYFVFSGMLMKWYALYGRAPNASSWVWTHHPDGKFWWDKVAQFGERAVEEATKLPSVPVERIFAPQFKVVQDANNRLYAGYQDKSDKSTIFIFYDVHAPLATTQLQYDRGTVFTADVMHGKRDLLLTREQVQDINKAVKSLGRGKKAVMFYNTMGHDILKNDNVCHNTTYLTCQKLGHYKDRYEGESLYQLSQFCQENPKKSVAYLHNRIPSNLQDKSTQTQKQRFLRHMTMAALSSQCTDLSSSAPAAQGCNVCGLMFYTMPYLAMNGGMFSATCDYVNKLLPPTTFVSRMEEYTAEALLQKLVKKLNSHIFADRPEYYGLGRHAMHQWIGSHPSLVPCDLTGQTIDFWMKEDRSTKDFNFLAAEPRHHGAPWDYNVIAEAEVRHDASLRTRESQFLAGHVLRWHFLYQQLPDAASWVYNRWFPDGDLWADCITSRGRKCFDEITTPYADSKEVS